ncbi:hypothetical protein F4779DRAFT_412973, partial [Xylariaceae sp. FL0662B]
REPYLFVIRVPRRGKSSIHSDTQRSSRKFFKMRPAILLLSLITAGFANVLPIGDDVEEDDDFSILARNDPTVNGYVCETTEGSPKAEDVTKMINNLKKSEPKRLCIPGSGGVDCSPTWRHWSGGSSAAFQACGAHGGGMFRCSQAVYFLPCLTGCGGTTTRLAGAALSILQKKCQKNGRVGGYIDYKSGDLKIIHS